MDTRPDFEKYKSIPAIGVLRVVAVLAFIAAIFCIVSGLMGKNPIAGISIVYIGLICLVTGALLYAISSITEDLHWQSYLQKYYGEETYNYHIRSLQKLDSIEAMLLHQYCQQNPYKPPMDNTTYSDHQ